MSSIDSFVNVFDANEGALSDLTVAAAAVAVWLAGKIKRELNQERSF